MIKKFNELNMNDESTSFDSQVDKTKNALETLIKEYDELTKLVSPKYWRSTGHVFAELNKMKEEIARYTEVTEEEKSNSHYKDMLGK